jgi:hypothetical protein
MNYRLSETANDDLIRLTPVYQDQFQKRPSCGKLAIKIFSIFKRPIRKVF